MLKARARVEMMMMPCKYKPKSVLFFGHIGGGGVEKLELISQLLAFL